MKIYFVGNMRNPEAEANLVKYRVKRLFSFFYIGGVEAGYEDTGDYLVFIKGMDKNGEEEKDNGICSPSCS